MNVYLAQFNIAYSGQKKTMYLPYSVGCVWAYANQSKEVSDNFKLKEFLIEKVDPKELVESLDNPKVFAVSTYVWNYRYSMDVTKRVKQKFPDCVIIIGGPHVPASSQEWLLENNHVDYAVYKEGEVVFHNIFRRILGLEHSTKGMGFIENGSLNKQERPIRIEDLSIVPSPYTAGYFDPLIEKYKNTDVVLNSILETNRGCPFKCTFCDWGQATESKVKKQDLCRVQQDIMWFAKNKIEWVAVADANFGAFKDRDLAITDFLVKTKMEHGFPKLLHISFHKNQGEHLVEIAKKLIDAGMNKEFTASLQSTSPTTLEAIKRKNISPVVVDRMKELSVEAGFSLHTELMTPLPGETYDSINEGLEYCVDNGITFSLLPVQILPNAEMNEEQYREKYGLVTQLNEMIEDHPWIKEHEEMVIATSTMNKKQFNDIMLIGYFIQSFHTTGFTDLIAKYYKKTDHINFTTFYTKLINYFSTCNNAVIDKHIKPLINHVENKTTNRTYAGVLNVPMYNDLGKENRELFFSEIKEFCKTNLPKNDNLADLIALQYNWQNHATNGLKFKLVFQSNLFDYINNNKKFELYDCTHYFNSAGIKKGQFLSLGHYLNYTKATGGWKTNIQLN